jgi:hypothetical protein
VKKKATLSHVLLEVTTSTTGFDTEALRGLKALARAKI